MIYVPTVTNMNIVDIDEARGIVESKGLEMIEDIKISISNGKDTKILPLVCYMTKPPFKALYSRVRLDKIVKTLLK